MAEGRACGHLSAALSNHIATVVFHPSARARQSWVKGSKPPDADPLTARPGARGAYARQYSQKRSQIPTSTQFLRSTPPRREISPEQATRRPLAPDSGTRAAFQAQHAGRRSRARSRVTGHRQVRRCGQPDRTLTPLARGGTRAEAWSSPIPVLVLISR
jgi:hypothetical protein